MDTLADYYAKRAPEYERIYHKPERQADLHRLRQSVAATIAGRRVLEVACGTGWWTEVLATTAESVVATDLNEEVLAVARTKPHAGNVLFQRADAFALDQVSGDFDAALAVFWWSHLTSAKLARFLSVLHRRIQPGGLVVFIDNIFVPGSSTPISRRDDEGNTYQMRKLDDGTTTEVLKNFPTDAEIKTTLGNWSRNLLVERLTYFWQARYSSSEQTT